MTAFSFPRGGGQQDDSSLYSGGNGGSIEDAVVINAESTLIGVGAEYRYVSGRHGERGEDWEFQGQGLMSQGGKHYDAISIKTKDGRQLSYYFDISKFFGKP